MATTSSVPARRREFAALVRTLPGHWVANEHPSLLDGVVPGAGLATRPPREGPEAFLTALDGIPVGWAGPHGQFCA